MTKADVIIGGQYGSEAKGALAGWLAHQREYDTVISNSGSQAGHTFRYNDGHSIITRHVPIAGIIQKHTKILLSPACVIDPEVLLTEIDKFNLHSRIHIHPNAAVIHTDDISAEIELTEAIGSTGKGNGVALTNKIMRKSRAIAENCKELKAYVCSGFIYHNLINGADDILIEGAQGFSLSLDEKFYPYCTSRNCWVGQALADAWIHPNLLRNTYMVIRTFPIRVAGHSGDYYPDQHEIYWDDIGVEPEITTVTQRVRRVFTFSELQVIEAASINRPTYLAISHLDYLPADQVTQFVENLTHSLTNTIGYCPILIYGAGPQLKDWSMENGATL